jgi:hypothetical protein
MNLLLILVAVALMVLLSYIPGGDALIYPFRLFVTFVHEGSHMLATLLTGGIVDGITINSDGSGHAISRGGWLVVIASAGYLGTALSGHVLLRLLERNVWPNLVVALIGIWMLILAFTGQTLFTIAWGLAIAATFIAIAVESAKLSSLLLGFLGVQLIANAFYDLNTLLQLNGTGVYTDAVLMQQTTHVPSIIWSGLWLFIATALLTYHGITLLKKS